MSWSISFYRWMQPTFAPHSGPQSTGPEGPAESGTAVTEDRAYQVAAAWACIKILSEVPASLPLMVYERKPNGGRQIATDHWLFSLLHDAPNRYQTPVEFKETMQLHLVSRGNAYSRIMRNGVGDVSALIPLHSSAVDPELSRDGTVTYKYRSEAGEETLQSDDVLHLRLFGPGLIAGLSPLAYARQSLGLVVNVQDSTSKFFKNGMRPAGAIQSDRVLTPEHRHTFRENLKRDMGGSDNAFKVLFLEGGFKYSPITLSPEDAQMLEQWAFGVEEICRFFAVPPQLIGHTDKASSWASSLENLNLFFLQYSLRPYLTRWEQAINQKLLSREERSKYYAAFNLDGLLRADFKSRTEGYARALGGPGAQGWMRLNEIRRLENLEDEPGGDKVIVATHPVKPKPSSDDDNQKNIFNMTMPEIKMPDVHVDVKSESPQVNVSPERRGSVIREVVEMDAHGIPSKVVQREVSRTTVREVVERDSYGIPTKVREREIRDDEV